MKGIAVITIFISLLSLSCGNKINREDPELVLKEYCLYISNFQYNKAYDYLADTSKKLFSFQDFSKSYDWLDSLDLNRELLSIEQMSYNSDFPNYRCYKLNTISNFKGERDSFLTNSYYTVHKDSIGWGVIWTNTLASEAYNDFSRKEHLKAIEKYKGILEIDPFDVDVMNYIGWSYLRLGNLDYAERYAKQANSIDENDDSYTLLGAIYDDKGYYDLAIESYKKSNLLSVNPKSNSSNYSNMAISYLNLKEFTLAHGAIEQSLKIDSVDTHSWMIKGSIFAETGKNDSAIYCLSKAVTLAKLVDDLQEILYSALSEQLLIKTKTLQKGIPQRDSILQKSKEYILKALEIDPENKQYQSSLRAIKALIQVHPEIR